MFLPYFKNSQMFEYLCKQKQCFQKRIVDVEIWFIESCRYILYLPLYKRSVYRIGYLALTVWVSYFHLTMKIYTTGHRGITFWHKHLINSTIMSYNLIPIGPVIITDAKVQNRIVPSSIYIYIWPWCYSIMYLFLKIKYLHAIN